MNFNEYQIEAHKTAVYEKVQFMPWIYPLLGLNGEVGEVTEKLKKCFRDQQGFVDEFTTEDVAQELGDALWYIAELATQLGINLDYIAELNVAKLQNRMMRGAIHGSGDSR